MWLACQASDQEIAGFTPISRIGFCAIVHLERHLTTIFQALLLLASSSALKSDTQNQANKGNVEIFKSSSEQCILTYVYRLM